jgi:hypothetical protein
VFVIGSAPALTIARGLLRGVFLLTMDHERPLMPVPKLSLLLSAHRKSDQELPRITKFVVLDRQSIQPASL